MIIKLNQTADLTQPIWVNVDQIVKIETYSVGGLHALVTTSILSSPSNPYQFGVLETPDAIMSTINALKHPVSMSGTVSETVALQGG